MGTKRGRVKGVVLQRGVLPRHGSHRTVPFRRQRAGTPQGGRHGRRDVVRLRPSCLGGERTQRRLRFRARPLRPRDAAHDDGWRGLRHAVRRCGAAFTAKHNSQRSPRIGLRRTRNARLASRLRHLRQPAQPQGR